VRRVCIVGNSGSGKTTLARGLAVALGVPHVELDAFNHRSGWTEAPAHEFRAEVAGLLAEHERTRGGWVVDGNYRSRIGNVVQPDLFVWLDYPRSVVLRRIVSRTLTRVLLRRELWNGNRERWRNLVALDPRQNIVLWSWTQHGSYRTRYDEAAAQEPGRWVRLRHPREAERWLRAVGR
jgi:adenylate kinase family enzyme